MDPIDAPSHAGPDESAVGSNTGRHVNSNINDELEADGPASTMRTVLGRFSEAFDQRVRPLTDPLAKAVETLGQASQPIGDQVLLADLRELAHHVQALVDKVAGQHAYVLIFGPLKSGKSTFINALCRSYVSEVTSLPAYPCIVHVCHDTQPGYRATRYDGATEPFEDAAGLHDAVEVAHRELVQRIRQIEAQGTEFDPDTHMPEAIRRIDVKVTADDLAQSGAVLVDTPGLYARMKFGYDRMTRNFRDAAACAIFIVKADNLFLEQVFQEFHELLDLFSRIFLIVNIDTTKKDLQPDGQLAPSLEHEDPGRIVKAFEDLAMSAGLKAAADTGRLRIYPVDLLSAASYRLRHHARDTTHTATGQADFDVLLGDLTQYLNSSDYLRAFMADSLRRASTLLEQLHKLTGGSHVTDLAARVISLRQEHQAATGMQRAVSRLRDMDWHHHAQSLRAPLHARSREQAQQVGRTTGYALTGAIDAWFESDRSLAQLNDDEITPLLAKAQKEFLDELCLGMQQRLSQTPGGLSVLPSVIGDLMTCGIDMDDMAQQTMAKIDPHERVQPPVSRLVGRDIPVRRRWWDWLLLRSKRALADRLFGPPPRSMRPIPAAAKTKRLGGGSLETMKTLAADQLEEFIQHMTQHVPDQLFLDYTGQLTEDLGQVLGDQAEEAALKLADLERQLDQAQRVLTDLNSLRNCGEQTQEAVRDLTERFSGDSKLPGGASVPRTASAGQETSEQQPRPVIIVAKQERQVVEGQQAP